MSEHSAGNDVAREVEQVLYDHREDGLTCYDHTPTPTQPLWCCVCGEHGLSVSWRAHVAEHIIRALPPAERP